VSFDLVQDIIATKLYPAFLVLFFFGLTIFIHELGHFWMAKRRGMKIERFSIGFGPKIWGFTKDGVDYRVSWFPFGGYVSLPQMTPVEPLEGKSETGAEQLPPAPPSSKIQVAFAGPVMNIVLAVVLACIVWWVGLPVPVNPSIIGWVEPGSLEEQMGIRPGDRIVQINDQPVKTWLDSQRAVAFSLEPTVEVLIDRAGDSKMYTLETEYNQHFGMKTINLYPQGRPYARLVSPGSPAEQGGVQPGDKFLAVEGIPVSSAQELIKLINQQTDEPTELKVMRRGKIVELVVTPRLDPDAKVGRIGVELGDEFDYEVVRPGPTPVEQFGEAFDIMSSSINALIHYKQTGVGLRSFSGPVGIAGGWWQEIKGGGIRRGLKFAVLINIALAVFNILPIPVLDGGHIVFSAIEAIRRRPINARLVQTTSLAFALLLISFMLYVTYFDFLRIAGGRIRREPKPPATAPAEPAPQP
jgi:regulator of sigma E protease